MVFLPALQCQHLLGCRPLLLLGHIQLILGLLQLTAHLLRPAVGIRQLPTQLLQLTCQPLQLVGTGQYTGAAADAAAGHGAAPVDDLPVQRHDAKAVLVPPGHGDAAVQILHHHRAPQQVLEHAVVALFILHQLRGNAHEAVLLLDAALPQLLPPDSVQRQEGGSSAVPLLQVADGGLSIVLRVHHDILQGAAQGDLDGHGVLLLRGHEAGHRAVYAPQAALVRRLHHQLHRTGKALILLLHLRQQADAILHGRRLTAQLLPLLGAFLRPALSPAHFQAVALNDVLRRCGLLTGLLQRLTVLRCCALLGLAALLQLLQLTAHLLQSGAGRLRLGLQS